MSGLSCDALKLCIQQKWSFSFQNKIHLWYVTKVEQYFLRPKYEKSFH